jgi:ABC-type lipoprotein release transport system permease subunit
MNPLSAWTFSRRHRRRTALLLGLTGLVTAGFYLMIALVWAVYVELGRSNLMFLSRFSVVMPESTADGPSPAVVARIRGNPDVARVVPAAEIWIELPGIMPGEGSGSYLLGLAEEDAPAILERCGATLKEGRLLEPRTNGLLLSSKVAAALDLEVGDTIHESVDRERYGNVVAPLEVVGILESDVRLGVVSLEFLDDHEAFGLVPRFLVVPREGRDAAVDDFLLQEIQTPRTDVQTFQGLNQRVMDESLEGFALLALVVVVVTAAFALVVAVVNWMAFSRRLPEFGTMHAVGLGRGWLVRRLTLETAALAAVGWAAGIGLSWLILGVLDVALFAPRGHDLPVVQLVAVAFSMPLPLAVAGSTLVTARRVLSRLDPVAIIERGGRSREGDGQERTASRSSSRPLASATFYGRHRRRAVLLVGAMSSMIVAVVLVIFVLAISADAQEPGLGYLRRMSVVRPWGAEGSLDPGVATQARMHPAVDRVIPVAPRFHMVGVSIPPFIVTEASPFGVYAEDMAYLVDLYGLELKEGHLPRPRSNEMVIPETIARNRDLEIGDVIGNPDHPAYPGSEPLPAEFVISGIFRRAPSPEDENWLGFVSLEFVESHEAFPVPDVPPLMVVPVEGQKDALDDWLETELAGIDVSVLTYRREVGRIRASARDQMLTMGLLESVVAIVAAAALVVLNHVFVSRRQSEFGVLHALGYGRTWLVWRTVREAFYVTGIAWGLSALLFLAGMVAVQVGVFTPLGLRADLGNLTPWLFTLPIPVAVLAATAATTSRTLSRLDAVAIVERR